MPYDTDTLTAWICLNEIDGLGIKRIQLLLETFQNPLHIFQAGVQELAKIIGQEIANRIQQGWNEISVQPVMNWLAQNPKHHVLTIQDERYPQILREIPSPPILLYAKGNLQQLTKPALAIVGSRNATAQGLRNAESFAHILSENGICVVSGLAVGVDVSAHRGALTEQGGTIAVMGTGIDLIYPARHKDLALEIFESGLILSEYPLKTPSKAQNFPRRNRIISGLSRGVLVIEATLQSGSLITTRYAIEQNREVFAIPGSIHSPLAKGCHHLIKQGAKLVDDVRDILEELVFVPSKSIQFIEPANEQEKLILEQMGFDPVSPETLVERTLLPQSTLLSTLLLLELNKQVSLLADGRYQRVV